MSISRADAHMLGIPEMDFPIFRQYVRDKVRVPLNKMTPSMRDVQLVRLATQWLEERAARMSEQERAVLRRTAESAAQDRARTEAQARASHPMHKREDLIGDPAELGAEPLSEMPARPRKRRR
jgi:hypothetical protein